MPIITTLTIGSSTWRTSPKTARRGQSRSLYDGMIRILVTPSWAKLIDFETTLPSAVEDLYRERDEKRRGA